MIAELTWPDALDVASRATLRSRVQRLLRRADAPGWMSYQPWDCALAYAAEAALADERLEAVVGSPLPGRDLLDRLAAYEREPGERTFLKILDALETPFRD
ncbi:MAG: hypothetical protein M3327_11395 [Actinomycetota bacterium]|nr:hypothetical protein [Actinomycetota bacterium]